MTDRVRHFNDDFVTKLEMGKYTRWAVDIDDETLRLVLWFVGEYGIRGGLHEDRPHHWRTLGASMVLCRLRRGETMTFDEAVEMMEKGKNVSNQSNPSNPSNPSDIPSDIPSIQNALADLFAAREASELAEADLHAKREAESEALAGAVNVFLDLYNALPVDIRNKIRHAINTSACTNTKAE